MHAVLDAASRRLPAGDEAGEAAERRPDHPADATEHHREQREARPLPAVGAALSVVVGVGTGPADLQARTTAATTATACQTSDDARRAVVAATTVAIDHRARPRTANQRSQATVVVSAISSSDIRLPSVTLIVAVAAWLPAGDDLGSEWVDGVGVAAVRVHYLDGAGGLVEVGDLGAVG